MGKLIMGGLRLRGPLKMKGKNIGVSPKREMELLHLSLSMCGVLFDKRDCFVIKNIKEMKVLIHHIEQEIAGYL